VWSEDSIDLVRKCLDRDVEKRITVEEILTHPFALGPDGSEGEGDAGD
jgi:serine/threonine protein kinase